MKLNSGKLIGLAGLITLLTACSAGSDCSGENCANLTAPEAIAFGFPSIDAISEIETTGQYRRNASVVVTDDNGNSLPDGTIIHLDAIDAILAKGTIDGAAVVTGNTLTDDNPETANDVADIDGTTSLWNGTIFDTTLGLDLGMTGSDFSNAYTAHGRYDLEVLERDDIVLLFGPVPAEDRVRRLSAAPGSATTVTVSQNYTATYDGTTNLDYVIGKAASGIAVFGVDPATDEANLAGIAVVQDGIARFQIQFPAEDEFTSRIGTGCYASIDYRYEKDTSEVYVIAQVDGLPQLTAVTPYCFDSIAESEIIAPTMDAPGMYGIQIIDANRNAISFASVNTGCALDTGNLTTRADNNGYCLTTVPATGGPVCAAGVCVETF